VRSAPQLEQSTMRVASEKGRVPSTSPPEMLKQEPFEHGVATRQLKGWEGRRLGLTPDAERARFLSEEALNSKDPIDRINALRGLANLSAAHEKYQTFRLALEDPDAQVRLVLLSLLPKLGNTEFLATLQEVAVSDPSPAVRRRAKQLYEYFSHEDLATREPGN